MTEDGVELELRDRLKLIESMIAEGRRTTESWGWTFVFWGLAYYVAIAWTALTHYPWAWLITMTSATMLMWVVIGIKSKGRPEKRPGTTMSRAIFSIWMIAGISMSFLLVALGFSGRFSPQLFVAVLGATFGTTNGTSGVLLRWRAQFACAVVWWAASVTACFAGDNQSTVILAVAIFFCQIVFGGYAMIVEGRARRQGAIHA